MWMRCFFYLEQVIPITYRYSNILNKFILDLYIFSISFIFAKFFLSTDTITIDNILK